MNWTFRILEAQDPNGRTVFDVIATTDVPAPDHNPDLLVGCYPGRLKAMVAAGLLARRQIPQVLRPKVVPFPGARTAR